MKSLFILMTLFVALSCRSEEENKSTETEPSLTYSQQCNYPKPPPPTRPPMIPRAFHPKPQLPCP